MALQRASIQRLQPMRFKGEAWEAIDEIVSAGSGAWRPSMTGSRCLARRGAFRVGCIGGPRKRRSRFQRACQGMIVGWPEGGLLARNFEARPLWKRRKCCY